MIMPGQEQAQTTEHVEEEKPPIGKILVVDDNSADIIGMIWRQEGFVVLEAGNAEEALEIIEREKPDVTLLDSEMPLKRGEKSVEREAGQTVAKSVKGKGLTKVFFMGRDASECFEDGKLDEERFKGFQEEFGIVGVFPGKSELTTPTDSVLQFEGEGALRRREEMLKLFPDRVKKE